MTKHRGSLVVKAPCPCWMQLMSVHGQQEATGVWLRNSLGVAPGPVCTGDGLSLVSGGVE